MSAAPTPRFPSLLASLRHAARERPDRDALLFEGRPTSFLQLWRALEAFAQQLLAAGIGPGEPVLLLLGNGPHFFAALYGCQRAGAIPVPLAAGSGPTRVRDLARQCRAVAVVSDVRTAATAAAVQASGLQVLAAPDLTGPLSATTHLPPLPAPDDLALLQFTSGSTGLPKAVALTQRNIMVNLEQLIGGMAIDEHDVFVSWLPCNHDMGLILMTMVPMLLGCRLVLLPTGARSLPRWLQAIERHRGTVIASPDFAYRWCLRFASRPQRYDLSSLRLALNAAEPVRLDTLERFEAAFGLERIMIAGYGLAEACVGVSSSPPSQRPAVDADGFVSVGKPFAGVDIAIVVDDEAAAPGVIGEIAVRSPANGRGYYLDPDASAALAWRHGYLCSGDLGYLDAEGRLYVVGRSKNTIVRQGRTIAPFEVEVCADAAVGVARAAAIGVDRDDLGGENVVLLIEIERGTDPATFAAMQRIIVNAVFERLGFRPARALLVGRGTLPRTHNGKVRYRELREAYLRGDLADRVLFGELPAATDPKRPTKPRGAGPHGSSAHGRPARWPASDSTSSISSGSAGRSTAPPTGASFAANGSWRPASESPTRRWRSPNASRSRRRA